MRHYCITGNIGSGKTTVCREFERLSIPVYYTDTSAKRLMTEDAQLRQRLSATFGPETYLPDGSLNRAYLAGRVFGNEEELKRLNGLVHPAVHRDYEIWLNDQAAPYTLYETALVYEIGAQDRFDGVLVVAAPEYVRRQRVMARDGTSAEAFAARASKQWPDDRKEQLANYLLVNDGKRLIFPQVLRLHRRFSALR